jgi:hypothetical protein
MWLPSAGTPIGRRHDIVAVLGLSIVPHPHDGFIPGSAPIPARGRGKQDQTL